MLTMIQIWVDVGYFRLVGAGRLVLLCKGADGVQRRGRSQLSLQHSWLSSRLSLPRQSRGNA
jgi:hypothetical protein